MGYQTWIPEQLERYGVPYACQPGWSNRGSSSFNPRGLVIHHDAFNSSTPSSSIISTMVNGRPDLPGPLCHVWIDDDRDDTGAKGDPMAYVIAAGTANHAGSGSWKGLSGNSSVLGIEARNNGLGEPWSPQMLDCYGLVCAALLDGIGADTGYLCGHKEWTTRKIDPAGIDMPNWRQRVADLRAYGPPEPLDPEKGVSVLLYIRNPNRPEEIWVTDGMYKRWVKSMEEVDVMRVSAGLQGVANVAEGSMGATDVSFATWGSIPVAPGTEWNP